MTRDPADTVNRDGLGSDLHTSRLSTLPPVKFTVWLPAAYAGLAARLGPATRSVAAIAAAIPAVLRCPDNVEIHIFRGAPAAGAASITVYRGNDRSRAAVTRAIVSVPRRRLAACKSVPISTRP